MENDRRRLLGAYEKYNLVRTIVGIPPLVVFAASVPRGCIITEKLERTVRVLLDKYALLRAVVVDPFSRSPAFATGDFNVEQIICVSSGDQDLSSAIESSRRAAEFIEIEKGPLWRVTLYRAVEAEKDFLTLAINHTISDGISTRNLFAELLSFLRESSTSSLNEEQVPIPKSQEEAIDIRPPWSHVARHVLSDVLSPYLPRSWRPSEPVFFPNLPSVTPYGDDHRLLIIPKEVLASLKLSGKSNGVMTLHPVIATCALAALTHAALVTGMSVEPFRMETPMSIRAEAGGPSATGNFVASASSMHACDAHTDFWTTARDFAAFLKTPATRTEAKYRFGMFAWSQHPVLRKEATQSEMLEYAENLKREPLTGTIEISNIAVLPTTGWESEEVEVAWSQMCHSCSTAIVMTAGAIAGGPLTFSTRWRTNLLSNDFMDAFFEGFKRALRRAVSSGGDATFEDLCETS